MLSLTKKSDAGQVSERLWHPDFRNSEKLPDTKVVRTNFSINALALAIAAGLALWLGYREYTDRNIRDQIAEAQRLIDANRKQNVEAVRLSKIFEDEQKKLTEAAAFMKVPVTPLEFVDMLGQTLPREIIIDYVDCKKSAFQIRGRVAGSPDQASGIASNYIDQLRADARLNKVFDPITLNRIDRDATAAYMAFDISLTVKGGKN